MTRRIAFALLATVALLLVAAQGASAASSATIHRDAADGVIDGDYSVSELRAADRTAPAELREYFGWEDAYQNALQRKANPDTPPVAVPVDENQDGRIDAKEREKAEKRTKQAQKKARQGGDDEDTPEAEPCDEDADEDECVAGSDETEIAAGDDEDDGGSPLIWLIVGLPLLIVAVGAWRMYRRRPGSTKGSDAA